MRLLAFIGVIAILGAIAVGGYLFGGFYNVAANERSPGIIDQAIEHVREASIARRAGETPPISLDDPANIQAGARAYATRGCVICHSGPGVQRDLFARNGMNPGPPGMRRAAEDAPGEIFWIVRNGIRMTAMPSFGRVGVKDEEIWHIVAFVKDYPKVSVAEYKAWTTPPTPAVAAPPAAATPAPGATPAPVQTPTPAPAQPGREQ
jgi:Cytochrome C oxidase, cbb3-type, subunit III